MAPPSLHVGMLTTAFPRFAGDLVGNFVFFFCRELARRGVRVTVVTPHTPGTAARETMEGVEVRRFRYLAPASLERVGYLGGTLTNLKQVSVWAGAGIGAVERV